jgi:hypothetical protein
VARLDLDAEGAGEQAIYFGETPVNTKACDGDEPMSKGSCQQYHADAPLAYFKQIYFWKTPIADCGNGKKTAWTTRSGSRPGRSSRAERSRGRAAVSAARSSRRPWLKALALLGRRARVLAVYIAALVALVRRPSGRSTRSRADRPHLDARQLPQLWNEPTYRTSRCARSDRGGGDGHRRADRVPVRVLHGAAREPAPARVLFVLVLLPLWASYLARSTPGG